MKRNLKIDGIVIRCYRIQEYHKGAVIFSPQSGIIHAIAYGGFKSKSKLGAVCQPLNRGFFEIYHDPVKNSNKISEYDPKWVYESVKSDLKKYFAATLWLEVAVKSQGGGEAKEELYQLISCCLNMLETAESSQSSYNVSALMIQFLLRVLILLGCDIYNYMAVQREIILTTGTLKYVQYSLENKLETALNVVIDNCLLKQLKSLLYSILQDYLEDSLSSLKIGKDYLF